MTMGGIGRARGGAARLIAWFATKSTAVGEGAVAEEASSPRRGRLTHAGQDETRRPWDGTIETISARLGGMTLRVMSRLGLSPTDEGSVSGRSKIVDEGAGGRVPPSPSQIRARFLHPASILVGSGPSRDDSKPHRTNDMPGASSGEVGRKKKSGENEPDAGAPDEGAPAVCPAWVDWISRARRGCPPV